MRPHQPWPRARGRNRRVHWAPPATKRVPDGPSMHSAGGAAARSPSTARGPPPRLAVVAGCPWDHARVLAAGARHGMCTEVEESNVQCHSANAGAPAAPPPGPPGMLLCCAGPSRAPQHTPRAVLPNGTSPFPQRATRSAHCTRSLCVPHRRCSRDCISAPDMHISTFHTCPPHA